MFDEQLDDGEVAAFGGEVKWERVVSVVADVRIGAAFEQRPHDGFVSRAEMQRRAQAGIAGERAALVDDGRMFVEDRGDRVAASPLPAAASSAVSGVSRGTAARRPRVVRAIQLS